VSVCVEIVDLGDKGGNSLQKYAAQGREKNYVKSLVLISSSVP
jgi:hypothetical protein